MKIEILMIGKISSKEYKSLANLYLKRCTNRISVSIINCRDANEMCKRIAGKSPIIALDEHSKCRDTMEFTRWLEKKINNGINCLTFCLGAAAGLDERVKSAATELVSLSPLTLNHQLALLVLAEQLYRSVSIMSGGPYHKA